ncbi:MAG TPA: BamA/TamA family outer membrane protein [Vicinamibacterales bacterium]|nr:BamA/TamA family outer membrane protein [Vicinamibacterales bacterium]
MARPGRRTWSPVIVCLTALLAAVPAAAAAPAVEVHAIRFVGVRRADAAGLRALMVTRQSSWLPWGKRYDFDRATFEVDLQRVRAYYVEHGFPDVKVTSGIHYNREHDQVDLTITVDAGPGVLIRSIDFTGFDAVPAGELKHLRADVPLALGAPLGREALLTAHAMAVHELEDHGYPYAQVETEVARVGPMNVALTFVANPGPVGYFGPVQIVGNKTVSDAVIRRQLLYRPGERFSRQLVQDTQRKLYALGLFQFVEVQTVKATPPVSRVPTRITVTEGKHHHVQFGVGYGTEEKERLDAQWTQVNFLGGGRTAAVHGRWSSIDRGARIDFTQPDVFSPHFQLRVEGQRWYTSAPAYTLVASGGTATLTDQATRRTSWALLFADERDTSSIASSALNDPLLRNDLIALGLNPVTGEQAGTRVAIGIDFQRNTAGSLLNATHGTVISAHLEQAGEWLPGAFNYVLASADLRHYVSIGDRIVFANRVQAGDIRPQGGRDANIPFSKRYFLGGATSLRGWGRYEVSPLSGSGLPIGGDSMFMATSELRVPVVGRLGMVAFLDLGNVWAGPDGINFNDLRYSVGSGLRYETPVGPIRLDFGYQLNPIPGLTINGEPQTRQWRLHFSIGQAF